MFNYNNSTFISFAVYSEVANRDQRLFEVSEDLTSDVVDGLLQQASQRILTQLRNTDWWKEYVFSRDKSLGDDIRNLPSVNPDYIRSREQEFKDLNIYLAMAEYICPRVADFSGDGDSSIQKMKYYTDAYAKLFKETLEGGDWYDFNGDSNITITERAPTTLNLKRIR